MALFIGETPCPSSQCPEGWLWLKPVEGGVEIYSFDDEGWVLKRILPFVDAEGIVSPQNIQIHNLNITGNLFYNGDNGANADVTAGGLHMVVKEGIVTTLEVI